MADEEKPEQAGAAAEASGQGCPVTMHDEEPCGRPIYSAPLGPDKTPVCLMHSHDPNKDDAAFQAEFERILGYAGEGIADFSSFVFPQCRHPSRRFRASLIFRNAVFLGVTDFMKAEFGNEADFGETRFNGRAAFSGARFARDAHFVRAVFHGEVRFWEASFEGGVRFIAGLFVGRSKFSTARFNGPTFFSDAVFEEDAEFDQCRFQSLVDFGGAKFLRQARFFFSKFEEHADFVAAKFSGYAGFDRVEFLKEVNFGGCKFDSRGNFEKAIFGHDADFNASEFGEAAFIASRFLKCANFSSGKFRGHASFLVSIFVDRANFRRVQFLGDGDFTGVKFADEADFRDARFQSKANLKEAVFTGEVRFDNTVFTLEADFSSTRFETAVFFRETQFLGDPAVPSAIFTSTRLEKPDTVIFDNTYLDCALFHKCDVSKFAFSEVRWRRRKNGKCMVFDEVVDLKHPAAKALVPEFPGWASSNERNYVLIAEVYQQLKKNYDDRRDYWTAGDFHYGEMEMKRLSSPRRNRVLRWLHRNLGLVAWYKYTSECGESYVRPAVWLAALLVAFALLYPLAGLRSTDRAGGAALSHASAQPAGASIVSYSTLPGFLLKEPSGRFVGALKFFGHSAVTTLGVAFLQRELSYEPGYPWGRLLSWLQLLLTYTLVALFLLAVRRQFRR